MTEILPTRPAFMAHLVAAFPDWETSLRVGEAMIDGGAGLLEVQFPFSDPTADGPYIQRACADALDVVFEEIASGPVAQLRNAGFEKERRSRSVESRPRQADLGDRSTRRRH